MKNVADILNNLQENPLFHGFTCVDHSDTLLIADNDGEWFCPRCDYTQPIRSTDVDIAKHFSFLR